MAISESGRRLIRVFPDVERNWPLWESKVTRDQGRAEGERIAASLAKEVRDFADVVYEAYRHAGAKEDP